MAKLYQIIEKSQYPNIGIADGKKGAPLDTLEITCDRGPKTGCPDDFEVQACTDARDKQTLSKRARRKFLSDTLIPKLAGVADAASDDKQRRAYWQTYHCARQLYVHTDGGVTGKYCRRRWCPVCNAIRTAQLIKQYRPMFEQWGELYFVTLTVPNVPGEQLRQELEQMYRAFATAKNRLRQRVHRGTGASFRGVRKLECTYNAARDDFHPHFHVIVDGKQNAGELLRAWLELYPGTSSAAQDIRPADDGSVLELFKYFTKLLSSVGATGHGARVIYADALHVAFKAVDGLRTFQSFGFKLPSSDRVPVQRGEVESIASWIPELADWADTDSGELLSGYIPSEVMKAVAGRVIVRDGYRPGCRDFALIPELRGMKNGG